MFSCRSPYVRYADDLLLFGDDKGMLWATRDLLSEKLQTLRLRVHPDKTQIAPSVGGVSFLGFRNRPSERRLMSSGVKRFNRRLRLLKWRFSKGMTDGPRVRASLQAWLAHASKANTRGLIRAIFKQARFRRGN